MKNIICSLMVFACMAMGFVSSGQTTRFNNRNNDERTANVVTTTNATLTSIDSSVISANEGGVIQVTVIGYAKDTAHVVTGVIQARFNKRRGTLTLGASTESLAIIADTPLAGATFSLVSVNNNIYIRVQGIAATSIRWYCLVKRKSISTTL